MHHVVITRGRYSLEGLRLIKLEKLRVRYAISKRNVLLLHTMLPLYLPNHRARMSAAITYDLFKAVNIVKLAAVMIK